MEIHLYRLDNTAFRLLILWRGQTVARELFEAANYTEAAAIVYKMVLRLEKEGILTEETFL